MKKINLKGISAENIAGILILLLSLVNLVLSVLGVKTLPISNDEISNVVSTGFVIITSLYNTYKNRNISTAAQVAQQVTDSIKNGELLIEDVNAILQKCKNR